MQEERIVLTAEDQTGPAKKSANQNLQDIEDKAVKTGDAVSKAGSRSAEAVVAVTDRTRSQIDRVVAQVESRLNGLRSPLEKLEQMRSNALAKVGGDPAAIDRVTAAYGRLIEAEKMTEAEARRANIAAEQAAQQKARTAAIELDNMEKLRRANIVDAAQRRTQTPLQNLNADRAKAIAGVAGDPVSIAKVTAAYDQLMEASEALDAAQSQRRERVA